VIWLPGKGDRGEYWMYYTQRRAGLNNANGVDWVHGSAIGIATSSDGLQWDYRGTVKGRIQDGDTHIGRGHEAAFVWHWQGAYWNIYDKGRGLDVWRSEEGLSDWRLNTVLLEGDVAGRRHLDQGAGHHPWIRLQPSATGPDESRQEQMVLFYFTHRGKETYMQMAEITLGDDGKLLSSRPAYLPGQRPCIRPCRWCGDN
jgi:hypothetical protein